MTKFTKSIFTTLIFTLLLISQGYGQFSVELGASIPIGDFADDDGGGAKTGFNVRGGWDKLINENLGIATGVIVGSYGFDEDISGADASPYSIFVLEAGLLVKANENFNIKGMIVRAGASTPEVTSGSQVILTSASAGAFGLDIRAEYNFDKIYISANYLTFTPTFKYDIGFGLQNIEQNFGLLGINVGYKF